MEQCFKALLSMATFSEPLPKKDREDGNMEADKVKLAKQKITVPREKK